MTFDDELILISLTHKENAMGDIIAEKKKTTVLCDMKSVTRSEHYAAAAHDMKPSIVFVVNQYDYNDQELVEYKGKDYKVTRTYLPKHSKNIGDFETIELVCAGVDE